MTGERTRLACVVRRLAEHSVAVFLPEAPGECKMTLTFLPNGKLKVEQQGGGFGHNVRADGTFRKISKGKPKFDECLTRPLARMGGGASRHWSRVTFS
jgi:hypothetical protein